MSDTKYVPIPVSSFKNIAVDVIEDGAGNLIVQCIPSLTCTTEDTILNFQIIQPAGKECDYRFATPDVTDEKNQMGDFTISRSGKMLTACNAASCPSIVKIMLNAYDDKQPTKKGKHDPEVLNQPAG